MLAEVALEGQAWHFRSPGPRLSGSVRRGSAGRVAAIASPKEFLDDRRDLLPGQCDDAAGQLTPSRRAADNEATAGAAMFVKKRLQVAGVRRGGSVAPLHLYGQATVLARQDPVHLGSVGVTPEPHVYLRLYLAAQPDELQSNELLEQAAQHARRQAPAFLRSRAANTQVEEQVARRLGQLLPRAALGPLLFNALR